MSRLTAECIRGHQIGYWSAASKEEVVQKLGQYEDLGLTPKQIGMLIDSYITPRMIKEAKGEIA